jgi:TonB-dependent receptor
MLTRAGNQILMANFIGDYQNENFYDGQYDILPGTPDLRGSLTTPLDNVNVNDFNALFGTNYNAGDGLPYTGHVDIDKVVNFYETYRANHSSINGAVDLTDYDGTEAIYASYIMSEFNYKDWLMLMGGVRYERTDQSYTSRTGSPREEGQGGTGLIEITDVTAAQGYGEFLPMGHLRVKLRKWFDVRAAVTKTLARPNFFNLVPWESIDNSEQSISRGKPDLKHTTAINYDLFLSFYNKFGLFTAGGFYKQLDNIDYLKTVAIVESGNIYNGYLLTEPSNVENTSTVLGTELDLQINFRSLDGFISGFLLGANLTLAKSSTFYPLFDVNTSFIPEPPFFLTTLIDTFRTGPIVGQADVITNLTLGYEKGGFSGRISAVFQSRALSPGNAGVGRSGSGVGRIPELDFYDDQFWRFDIALKQKLPKKIPITLIANVNNLSNTPERALLGTRNLLTEEEFFGFTVDFGILYKFVNQ